MAVNNHAMILLILALLGFLMPRAGGYSGVAFYRAGNLPGRTEDGVAGRERNPVWSEALHGFQD